MLSITSSSHCIVQRMDSRGTNDENNPLPWRKFVSELIGTALLVLVGLSVVIIMFGTGGPVERVLPDVGLRRLITGFLFGTTGALIAISPLGKESGAHINPIVTLGFWLMGRMNSRVALWFVLAQLAGAILGALPLLAWGSMGESVMFGATAPGKGYTLLTVFMGEAITTFVMIVGLCLFLGFRGLRPYTPAMFPSLYSVMVYAESAISGTSTNPARTIGPAVISGEWQGWWIYWLGPVMGTLLAALVCRRLAKRIEEAKLYHFGREDRVQ